MQDNLPPNFTRLQSSEPNPVPVSVLLEKKVQSLPKWLLMNGAYLALGVMLLLTKDKGLESIFVFFSVVVGALHAFAFGVAIWADEVREVAQSRPLPIPMWIDGIYDIMILGILLYTGHFIAAFVYLLGSMCLQMAYSRPIKSK